MEQASSDFCRGLLRGFFDRGGSVEGSRQHGAQVRLAHADVARLQAVQRMLLRLGITLRQAEFFRSLSDDDLDRLAFGSGTSMIRCGAARAFAAASCSY